MKVRVQFFAQLRDVAGTSDAEVEIEAGKSIRELLEIIYEQKPALSAHDRTTLTAVGVEFVDRNHVLRGGDEVAIMPPVQGG